MHKPCHGQKGICGVLQVVVLGITFAVPGIFPLEKTYNILKYMIEDIKIKFLKHHGNDCLHLVQNALRIFHIYQA